MKIILVLLLIGPIFCNAQKGVLKGNVFWKYNEYIGNRADAGCLVYLYCANNKKPLRQTSTDIGGNFTFENLDTGRYLVAIKSKQVKQRPEYHVRAFMYLPMEDFFGIDPKLQLTEIFDSAVYYSAKMDSISAWFPNKKKLEKERDARLDIVRNQYISISYKADKLFQDGSPYKDYLTSFFEIGGMGSLYLKVVKIESENTTENVIVDFGITYF